MDSGDYEDILNPWGLTDGMIDTATVNTKEIEQ